MQLKLVIKLASRLVLHWICL